MSIPKYEAVMVESSWWILNFHPGNISVTSSQQIYIILLSIQEEKSIHEKELEQT
jgi:hypothetical protein